MAAVSVRFWQVASGDTWASIAFANGVARNALVLANDQPTSTTTQPRVGRVLIVPLAGS